MSSKFVLVDNEAFRWGGVCGEYTKAIEYWKKEYDAVSTGNNPYISCATCGTPFADTEFPYAAFIKDDNTDKYRIRIICKCCAYKLADTVIEADGSRHSTKDE